MQKNLFAKKIKSSILSFWESLHSFCENYQQQFCFYDLISET